ncbi:type II toxin-antitoxin system RelE/ParE family toxin [soil metagenome]
MANKELIVYQTEDGKEPFTRWRKSLKDKATVARIDRRLDRVREGHYGDHKAVGEGVFELRLFFGSGYRVYFAEDGDKLVLLLCGGNKGSQNRDVNAAHTYWQDYQQDERQGG